MLKSQLYDRAQPLCVGISDKIIKSTKGMNAIVKAVYKRDALSVVTAVFRDLYELLQLRRAASESFKNFELRFTVMTAKFNANGSSVRLLESLIALIQLAHAQLDAAQRMSILAAAARPSTYSTKLDQNSSIDEYIKLITYESVASVLWQCDKPKLIYIATQTTAAMTESSSTAHTAKSYFQTEHRREDGKAKLTPVQLADLKSRCKCHKCRKYGHWASGHDKKRRSQCHYAIHCRASTSF